MATLKEHQHAMVDLLANGSAIPASAARLAHAIHDVLGLLLERDIGLRRSRVSEHVGGTIEDVRFAADLDVSKHKHGVSIETVNLRAELANVTNQRNTYKARCESLEAEVVKRDKIIDELRRNLEIWKNRI